MRRKLTAIVLLVAAATLGPIPSAMAATYGPYTKSCGSQFVEVQSHAKVTVEHYYPANTLQHIFIATEYKVRKTHTGVHSTSWKVWANDSIIVSGTKANCVSVG